MDTLEPCPSIRLEDVAEKLGLTPEKLKNIEDTARLEVYADLTWQTQLDASNKSQSGITGPTIARRNENVPSPYFLNEQVASIISELLQSFNEEKETTAIELLSQAERNSNMSAYQLSLTYKLFGECYELNGMNAKALSAYQKGLELNPSLSVKKAIKRLTSLK